ncbi:MAG: MBOAT family protein [Spirochaetes bacterium]|nr:MBOAT family protein [Spirochaetota bacterium]
MAERHFGMLVLSLLFFPRIVAGPIERPDFIRQFHEKHAPDYLQITGGIKLIAWGFFKKLVIADRAGMVVSEVYGHQDHYPGIYFILATLLFAVQVYSDFSGYTDIARGSAGVFGLRLSENFGNPYGAKSLSEFWRRWHISLTTWLRDYVYIPAGGNRAGMPAKYRNILGVFFISGMWHGPGLTYIAWGIFHGLLMAIGVWTRSMRTTVTRLIRLDRHHGLHDFLKKTTTCFLVCCGWIFFRSESLSQSFSIIRRILIGIADVTSSLLTWDMVRLKDMSDIARNNTILGFSRDTYRPEMLILALSIVVLWLFQKAREKFDVWETLSHKALLVRWSFYALLTAGILFFGMFTKEQFIYFRF